MNIKESRDNIFEYAKEKGFKDCEIYVSRGKQFNVKSFDQQIDDFSSSETIGVSFRGLYNDKMGYSYAEIIDESSIKMLVEEAMENAKSIDSKDKEFIHDGSGDYKELDGYKGDFENMPIDDKLQIALDIEKNLRAKDKVIQTNYCTYGEAESEVSIFNTKGLEKGYKVDLAYIMAMAVTQDKDNPKQAPKTGMSFLIAKEKSDLDIDYVVNDTHKRAISMLGAKSIKSGKYRMVMENRTVNDFMMTFSSIFSAENVQKGKSLLKGKLGQKIANDKLTIYDDPFIKKSISSESFDAEGVATYKKEVVEDGVLKTFLHNMKTAHKDGVKSTGNATKYSYKSPITVSPSNLVIEKGEISQEELIKQCGDGIFINSLAGLHSGANPISGDFSLMASGYKIENGELSHPIEQITISSNLFDLFNHIEALANDTEQSPPAGSTFFSPSILFKEINVAGSE
jgi:PmbA protein